MNQINLLNPVGPAVPAQSGQRSAPGQKPGELLDFREVLRQQTEPGAVRISNHCEKRLAQNGIEISPQQMVKLNQAVDKAAAKGSRESCIFMDDKAFIVSISNRALVTVVEGSRMKDSVFTNIDSAVII